MGGPKLSAVRRVSSVSPTTLACATGEPGECQKEDSSPPFWNPAPIHERGGDEAVPAPDITLWRIGAAWNPRRRKRPCQTWPSGSNALVRLVQVNVRHHDRLSPATCARLLPTAPTTPSRYRSARARHSSGPTTAGSGTVARRSESSSLAGQREFSWRQVFCRLEDKSNKDWLVLASTLCPQVPMYAAEVLHHLRAHEPEPSSD